MAHVYLGLGTNLGDREENLRAALRRLSEVIEIEAVSSVYRSEPVGYRNQPYFWNLVLRGRTELEPHELLKVAHEIEAVLGRSRSFVNAPRIIDIDVILYDDCTIDTALLTVPHPRFLERGFVLRPLAEIAPDLVDPRSGTPIVEHLRRASTLERTERLFSAVRLLPRAGERDDTR